MSYTKVKNISMNKKSGKINICGASSNVFPITYSTYNIVDSVERYHETELELLRGLNGGGLVLNASCYKWQYALMRTNEELYNNANTWQLYEDTILKYQLYYIGNIGYNNGYIEISNDDLKSGLYEVDYEGKDYILYRNKQEYQEQVDNRTKILENYYQVFMKYFNEEHEGKYYLYSENYGYIRQKGTKGAFYYSKNNFLNDKDLLDYFKAYCLAKTMGKDIEIRKIPKREYKATIEQINEGKERLKILGIDNYKYDLGISERYNIVGLNEHNFDLIQAINEFEEDYNSYVYHIIHSYTNFGELYNMFYVSSEKKEWQEDRKMLKNNELYSYVYNKTDKCCSEIGVIGFIKNGNVLERTF